MPPAKAKVTHYSRVSAEPVGDRATLRWLIDEKNDGAPNFALRLIEVEPGGSTPEHTHVHEHENFVLEGQGKVLLDSQWYNIGPGEVIFVPPGVRHQYSNTGKGTLRFLCAIPTERHLKKKPEGKK